MKPRHLSILLLSFLIIFCPNANGQENGIVITSDVQFEYAEKLFDQKDFETALIEFKRFIHFFPGDDHNDAAKFKIGICLFNLNKFHAAAQVFNEIILESREDDTVKEAVFFQSQAFMNMGNSGYAQIVLQNYLKQVEDIETRDRIYYSLASIHMTDTQNGKHNSLSLARENLDKISESGKIKFSTDHYFDLIYKVEHEPKKNPTAAGIFSIVPGGGFLYCGRYHDAFVTFFLNTGLIISAYEAFNHDNKALGGVISFVESGFYMGNIYGSISSAHKFNQAQTIKILNKPFSVISKFNPERKSYEISFSHEF